MNVFRKLLVLCFAFFVSHAALGKADAQNAVPAETQVVSSASLIESTRIAKESGCRYAALKLYYVDPKRTDIYLCPVDALCARYLTIYNPTELQSRTSLQISVKPLPDEVVTVSQTHFNGGSGDVGSNERCRADQAVEDLKSLF